MFHTEKLSLLLDSEITRAHTKNLVYENSAAASKRGTVEDISCERGRLPRGSACCGIDLPDSASLANVGANCFGETIPSLPVLTEFSLWITLESRVVDTSI